MEVKDVSQAHISHRTLCTLVCSPLQKGTALLTQSQSVPPVSNLRWMPAG